MVAQLCKYREPLTPEQFDIINGNDIVFQALSWYEDDFSVAQSSGSEEGEERSEYQIYVHGAMADGKSVCLKITEFIPYFYIMIPEKFQLGWTDYNTKQVFKHFRQILGKKNSYGLVTSTLVEKCKLYPFENLRKLKFIRLGFCTQRALRTLKYKIKESVKIPGIGDIKFDPYETNVQSVLRFTHIKNIKMTGWISVKAGKYTIVGDEDEISRAQISIETKWNDVNPYDCDQIAPFLIFSYDLECYSSLGYPKFPEADIDGDFISQIGCAFWEFGGEVTKKKQLVFTCVRSAESTDDSIIIVNCPNEKAMLIKFCLLIEREDPDIITGYNTWGFDDTYLWKRMILHGLDSYSEKLSRIVSVGPKLAPRTMSSGAYGHNQFNIITMHGRESFDVCFATRRDYKLNSFKLDSVAEHFLKLNKVNISIRMGRDTEDTPIDKRTNSYKLLFEIIQNKDPKEVAIVCEYCAHDSLLPLLLIEKLCFIPNYIEMAKSTRVPFDWLLLRGQQCKVFSQIVYEARKRDFVVPVFEYGDTAEEEEKYKGATVLHANTGAYFEPVAGLDFKSLYPSIMIAYNMCHSTIVIDDKYRNLPGIEYETIEWFEDQNKKFSFTFVQNIKGLLPSILEQLWEERNATKKEMKKHKGTFHETVLNGKQLAIKVTMNSAYGFAGASKGMLPCKPIAASVTAKGREMIAKTSKMAQELYNCVTTYGDSVTPNTSIMVRRRSSADAVEISFVRICDLASEYSPYDNFKLDGSVRTCKEAAFVNLEVWDGLNFTKIRRVIRHKVNKQIYRVVTNTGYVEVTEDHSLILNNMEYAKPQSIQQGTNLFCGYPEMTQNKMVGLGDLTIRTKGQVSASKLYYIMKSVGYHVTLEVSGREESFKLICRGAEACTSYDAERRFDQRSYDAERRFDQRSYKAGVVRQIELTQLKPDYVYDIETESGRFQAGVGDMIVKNTDSCYVKFFVPRNKYATENDYLEEHFRLAQECADKITATFKKPIELEFEKIMYPFFLYKKKRYAYNEWVRDKTGKIVSEGVSCKGIQLVRRDFCDYVKETGQSILDSLMFNKDQELAKQIAVQAVRDLLEDRVPMKKLIISKSLNDKYKVDGSDVSWDDPRIKHPHVYLAQRIKLVDPMNHPKPPDRVPYIFINNTNRSALQYEKVEHPDYIKSTQKIDALYYFEHQLKNCIDGLLEVVLDDPEQLYKDQVAKRSKIDAKMYVLDGNKDIRNFFMTKK